MNIFQHIVKKYFYVWMKLCYTDESETQQIVDVFYQESVWMNRKEAKWALIKDIY